MPLGIGIWMSIVTAPVDSRKGMDGLKALVKEPYGDDPFCGAIFVSGAKRADRVNLICWNGTGLCLYAERQEQGSSPLAGDREGDNALTSA